MTTGRLDVDQARVSKASDGSVYFDDPDAPWLVQMWVITPDNGRPVIARLRVDIRNPNAGITAAGLGRLPLSQMLHVATTATVIADAQPNEIYFRMLARPKGAGRRTWDAGHWERVLTVAQWATDNDRPGGGARAVADLWGVSMNPTAYRWIRNAHRLGVEAA